LDLENKKKWFAEEEEFRRKVLIRVMDIYKAGSQSASSEAHQA
jgi:hypothetical protein